MAESDKKITQLTTENVDGNTLFVGAFKQQDNSYISGKTTADGIGTQVNTAQTYNGLNTTAKTIVGAINEAAQGGGGSSTLAGLTDVDIDSPDAGQMLTYDDDNSKWVNTDASADNISFESGALATFSPFYNNVSLVIDYLGGLVGVEDWEAEGEYHAGDIVTSFGYYYECIVATATEGTWVSNEWTSHISFKDFFHILPVYKNATIAANASSVTITSPLIKTTSAISVWSGSSEMVVNDISVPSDGTATITVEPSSSARDIRVCIQGLLGIYGR